MEWPYQTSVTISKTRTHTRTENSQHTNPRILSIIGIQPRNKNRDYELAAAAEGFSCSRTAAEQRQQAMKRNSARTLCTRHFCSEGLEEFPSFGNHFKVFMFG
jgi:hypothetical protein